MNAAVVARDKTDNNVKIKACEKADDFNKENSISNAYTTNFSSSNYKYKLIYSKVDNSKEGVILFAPSLYK